MEKLIQILALLCLVIGMNATATEVKSHNQNKSNDKSSFLSKLSSNDPNYFVWAAGDNSDSNHLEFYLSLNYPLIDELWKFADLLFIYNGKYDFYIGSRDSSPIVSRLQNPGLAVEKVFIEKHKIRAGWYHESNGQSIETRAAFENTDHALDFVSRGWDYFGVDYQYLLDNWDLDLNLRIYCDCQAFGFINRREDKIFWEDVPEQPTIWDYDGFRARVGRKIDISWGKNYLSDLEIRGDIKTGIGDLDALAHISGKLTLSFHLFDFPLTLFYFNGYGKDISTYHRRDQYVAIGFELK